MSPESRVLSPGSSNMWGRLVHNASRPFFFDWTSL